MKFKATHIIMLLLIAILITGCATIASGTTQLVTFESTPGEATVIIDGKPIGKTPLTIRLDKKQEQSLVVEKEGYKPYSTVMQTELDPWFWGNIILGGFFGSTTDGASGAINRYAPGRYIVTLEPELTSQLDANTDVSQRENARKFLFINYIRLKKELGENSGEYTSSMLDILKIKSGDQELVINDIKTIMFHSENPEEFVSSVVNKYLTI